MFRRIALVAVVLLLPLEAQTSGSSTVRASSAHLAVSLTSVRKIFHRGQGEAQWHAEWRAEHQPEVDAALVRLQPVLLEFTEVEGLSLAEWSEELPHAWGWVPPEDPHSPTQVCASGPCRAQLQLWTATLDPALGRAPALEVEVALAAPPPEGALTRLNEAFARAAMTPKPGDR
ncbi:MAG: hypothetical protein JRJ84_20720 [Deltaproteobacteria bacterium]|nr:hypothetical protein [Deltaproteobacteria bacterium]